MAVTNGKSSKFLIKFCHSNIEFRLPELESLASLFKVNINYLEYDKSFPFLILTADDENKLYKVVQRCVGIKHLFELIEFDENKDKFLEKLKNNEIIKRQTNWQKESFKFEVDIFNRKINLKEKIDRIEELDFLPFDGLIDLNKPINVFYLIECYSETCPSKSVKFYFARHLIDGNRKIVSKLCLPNRKFISNTSMDVELSLIMANLARVKENDIVYDSFCGSGSLLVAVASFGGYCFGTDIDYKLLQGLSKPSKHGVKLRQKDESVHANFKQYKLENKYLDIIIGDSSLPIWRDELKFDSIITDPPYSIRESSQRIGSKNPIDKIPDEYLNCHLPQKIEYNLFELIKDLFNFASDHLVMFGRLVFWYPINKSTYTTQDLPTHPNFKIVSHAHQVLAGKFLRILITLEKISEPVCLIKKLKKCSIDENVQSSSIPLIPESIKQFKKSFHESRSDKCEV